MEAALRIPHCSFRQLKRSPKNDTKITHHHQGENRPDGENPITSTKKRKLQSFIYGYTRKDSSQVTNRVSKGTDAEILDPFDQKLSRAEAHTMLDCLLDLNLFIQNVRSSLRDLSSQVDDLERNYNKTVSSIRVGLKRWIIHCYL